MTGGHGNRRGARSSDDYEQDCKTICWVVAALSVAGILIGVALSYLS